MSHTSTDILAELDQLLVEDPHSPRLEQLLEVAGDLLQARGDPRGELIALERALPQGPARVEGKGALLERLCELEPELGGQLRAQLAHVDGLEFRGGRIAGLRLDLRRRYGTSSDPCTRIAELVASLSGSVYGQHTRALDIRVHHRRHASPVYVQLTQYATQLPLEFVSVSDTTRPRGHWREREHHQLCEAFPHLWFAAPNCEIEPLLASSLRDAETAKLLRELPASSPSRALRVHIGRGLSSGRKRTTIAACERLAQLGPAGAVFIPALELLLRPQVSHAAAWVLRYLRSFGAWKLALLPRVKRISGDAKHYPVEVRRLAGRCAEGLSAQKS